MSTNCESNKTTLTETAIIFIGELIVSLAVTGVYLLLDKFSYKVITGVALGSIVTVVNFLILTLSVNRAIDKFMKKRGDGELSDEEAEKFAKENAASVQFAATRSYVLRTLLMLGAFVLAFTLDYFEVIATLIPLLAYRPIIYVSELIRKRKES